MGMIPELKTAFCGCSLKTGCKVIGWASMVLGILLFVVIAAIIGYYSVQLSTLDEETFGKDVIKTLEELNELMVQDIPDTVKATQGNLVLLSDDTDTSKCDDVNCKREQIKKMLGLVLGKFRNEPEVLGRQLKDSLPVVLTVLFLIFLVAFLIHILITGLFLYGVHKNKPGYVLFYMVLCILGLAIFLPVLLNSHVPFSVKIDIIIYCFIQLYMIWVIYSFYRELRRPTYSAQMMLPGQSHLDGDAPIIVPSANLNVCYYPQK